MEPDAPYFSRVPSIIEIPGRPTVFPRLICLSHITLDWAGLMPSRVQEKPPHCIHPVRPVRNSTGLGFAESDIRRRATYKKSDQTAFTASASSAPISSEAAIMGGRNTFFISPSAANQAFNGAGFVAANSKRITGASA